MGSWMSSLEEIAQGEHFVAVVEFEGDSLHDDEHLGAQLARSAYQSRDGGSGDASASNHGLEGWANASYRRRNCQLPEVPPVAAELPMLGWPECA